MLAEVPMLSSDESVSENAGSGIPAMTGALGHAGLAAPNYIAEVTSLKVVLDRHGLLNPETDHWLMRIGASELDVDKQRTLALIHRGHAVDDQVLRAQLAMDSADARNILRQLVEDGWLSYPRRTDGVYQPGRRLAEADRAILEGRNVLMAPAGIIQNSVDDRIIAALESEDRDLSALEITMLADISLSSLRKRLRILVAEEVIIATAPPSSKNRKYRLARKRT